KGLPMVRVACRISTRQDRTGAAGDAAAETTRGQGSGVGSFSSRVRRRNFARVSRSGRGGPPTPAPGQRGRSVKQTQTSKQSNGGRDMKLHTSETVGPSRMLRASVRMKPDPRQWSPGAPEVHRVTSTRSVNRPIKL